MRKKSDRNCRKNRQPEDKTRELSSAFQGANQQSRQERRAFLEQTRSVGILSPSGSWLIKNAAAGVTAVTQEEMRVKNDALCSALGIDPKSLCPSCSCSHPTTHQASYNDCQTTKRDNQSDTALGPDGGLATASSGWDAIQGPLQD
jgi:hypothetical protein